MAKLAVFAVFRSTLSATGISFSAEILSHRRIGERNNSQMLAVISLFSAVLVNISQESGGALPQQIVSPGEMRIA